MFACEWSEASNSHCLSLTSLGWSMIPLIRTDLIGVISIQQAVIYDGFNGSCRTS